MSDDMDDTDRHGSVPPPFLNVLYIRGAEQVITKEGRNLPVLSMSSMSSLTVDTINLPRKPLNF